MHAEFTLQRPSNNGCLEHRSVAPWNYSSSQTIINFAFTVTVIAYVIVNVFAILIITVVVIKCQYSTNIGTNIVVALPVAFQISISGVVVKGMLSHPEWTDTPGRSDVVAIQVMWQLRQISSANYVVTDKV